MQLFNTLSVVRQCSNFDDRVKGFKCETCSVIVVLVIVSVTVDRHF